jgi:hypothetical protein
MAVEMEQMGRRGIMYYTNRIHLRDSGVKKLEIAGHWWLMPVILATQEAEIGRIKVQSQTE